MTDDMTEMMKKLDEATGLIDSLKSAVLALDDGTDPEKLADRVCDSIGMPTLKANPLFGKTVDCLREGVRK